MKTSDTHLCLIFSDSASSFPTHLPPSPLVPGSMEEIGNGRLQTVYNSSLPLLFSHFSFACPSMVYSPSWQTCSSVGSPWVTGLSGNIHLLWHKVVHKLRCGCLLWCGPSWAAGKYLLHHVLFHGMWDCLERSSASTPAPLTLVFPLLFLTLFVPFSSSVKFCLSFLK